MRDFKMEFSGELVEHGDSFAFANRYYMRSGNLV